MRPFISLVALCLPLMAGPVFADCGDGVRAMMSQLLAGGPYTAATTSTLGGVTSTTTAEILPPHGLHIRSEEAGSETETIVLDGKGWTKKDGVWAEMPEATARGMAEGLSTEAHGTLDYTIDDQCVGQAMIDGVGYVTYSFADDKDGQSSKTLVLLDTRTFRPYQMVVKGTIDGAAVTTVTSYSFGQTFDIEAPL